MEKFGGQTTTEYLQQANDALLTIVQIETKEALENVRAIPASSTAQISVMEVTDRRLMQLPKFLASTCSSLVRSTSGTTLDILF